MFDCKLDGEKFKDRDAAMNHLRDRHYDLIDAVLQDCIPEVEERVFEGFMNEEE